ALTLSRARLFFLFQSHSPHRGLPSFPTRRSSDLSAAPRSRRSSRTRLTAVDRCISSSSSDRAARRRCRPASSRPARRTSRTRTRSEEHTSELQSRENLVCRLLLEKKKKLIKNHEH